MGREDSTVWEASSKAVAKVSTLAKRSCGSFARAVNTTSSSAGEISGILPCKGAGKVAKC